MTLARRNWTIWISTLSLWLFLCPGSWADEIGFYFGTFDPPHLGHMSLAERSQQALKLDTLYVLPNYTPSNKPDASSFEHRHRMVTLETLRRPGLSVLPTGEFAAAYQRNPKDYIGEIIRTIRDKHGPNHQYFHIVGADSFNKMVKYGKLPHPNENRTVAVIQRKGYAIRKTAQVQAAMARKQVRLLDLNLPKISSSKIRKAFENNTSESIQDFLTPYTYSYIYREHLYGQAPRLLDILNWPLPEGYRSQIPKVPPTDRHYQRMPLKDFLPIQSLSQPLTLDEDAYLAQKWPESMRELITQTPVKIAFYEGLWPDTLAHLRAQGYQSLRVYDPERQRIGLAYLLGKTPKGEPQLIITHVFGRDRVFHQALQVARLMHGHGRSLDDLSLYLQHGGEYLSRTLFQEALRPLKLQPQDRVFIGYHGALNYLISDLKQFYGAQSHWPQSLTELDVFIAKVGRKLTHPSPYGSGYLLYWDYTLNGHRLVSFRNTYGESSRVLAEILLHKGMRNLILFGNGGGLSNRAQLHEIVAPVSGQFLGRKIEVKNLVADRYLPVSFAKVRSVLEETQSWLQSQAGVDVVDVENFDIFQAVSGNPQLTLRSGLLISDRPNHRDLSQKNEDAQTLIQRKRAFFFGVLKPLLK